jgi:ribosome-binding factor A
LKRQRRSEIASEFVDTDFGDVILSEEQTGSDSRSRKTQRKTSQYCRQVQRALNLALADWSNEYSHSELYVEDVLPAPDCGRLLVRVAIPGDRAVGEVISALRRDAGHLRCELAMVIARRRAPELSFVPVAPEGGVDE